MGIDVQTWVVLVVGISTVAAQILVSMFGRKTAERQANAAELQAHAAEAALSRVLSARFLAVLGGFTTNAGQVVLHNSGEHPAVDVRLQTLSADGEAFGAPVWEAVVQSRGRATLTVGFAAGDHAIFRACPEVEVQWADGLGNHRERLQLVRE